MDIPGVIENRVTLKIDNGIADVRLNRPDKRNALDSAMFTSRRCPMCGWWFSPEKAPHFAQAWILPRFM